MKYLNLFNRLTPRINITYKCDMFSYCAYCYSKEELNKYKTDITIENFKRIITWFKKGYNIENVVFLGGESTIHPEIEQIGKILDEEKVGCFIFTNGCFDQEKLDILKRIKAFHTIIFHYEEAFLNNAVLRQTFVRNLTELSKNKNIIFRFNTGKTNFEYRELIDLAKQFNASIWYSFTSPVLNRNIEYVPMHDMKKYVPQLVQFIKTANENNIEIFAKRPLPLCIFNSKEKKLFITNGGLRSICCVGSVCVNPDLSLIASPTLTELQTEPVINLSDLVSKVEALARKVEDLKWKTPTTHSCIKCDYWKKHECQGGCTVYKMCLEKQSIEPVVV